MTNSIKYLLSVLILTIFFLIGCKEKEEVLSPSTTNHQVTLKADRDTLTSMMPTTTIMFSLPVDSYIIMNITNDRKQQVTILIDQLMPAGYHSVQFNASEMASGVYYYNLMGAAVGSEEVQVPPLHLLASRKMVLIK